MLNGESLEAIHQLQLYLTASDAQELIQAISELLKDPDANNHKHIFGKKDGWREISVSIVTPRKLESLDKYSEEERRMFKER